MRNTYPTFDFVPMLPVDNLLRLGEICKYAWKHRKQRAIDMLLHFDLSMQQLAYHVKYEANPALVFQASIEGWSLDQIRQMVGQYRPDLNNVEVEVK